MKTDTHRNSPAGKPSSGDFDEHPSERETGPEVPSLHSDSTTGRDRLREILHGARDYWVPPNLLTKPPPTYTALVNYAYRGAWAGKPAGPVREAGIFWHRAASLPVTAVCRYVEWVAQRPGRAIPIYGLWRLLLATDAGHWLAANLVHPALAALGWALL